jgi:hypothetical protein
MKYKRTDKKGIIDAFEKKANLITIDTVANHNSITR